MVQLSQEEVERNRVTARRVRYEIANDQNFDLIPELVSEEWENHNPIIDKYMGVPRGHDGLRNMLVGLHASFPDWKEEILNSIAENDFVWTRYRFTGTWQGPFMGMPPNGKKFDIWAFGMQRFENGKVREAWNLFDVFTWFAQLGIIPEMAPPPAGARPGGPPGSAPAGPPSGAP